jgi:hypothetical protein
MRIRQEHILDQLINGNLTKHKISAVRLGLLVEESC